MKQLVLLLIFSLGLSHAGLTLGGIGPTGPTGLTGATGNIGPTGNTGPAGLITSNTGAIVGGTLLVGPLASQNEFVNAQFIAAQADTTETHNYNIGVVGEAVGAASDTTQWGVGVYGAGHTSGNTRSAGILGDGSVSNSSDGGSAIGVRGYATSTHTGGLNIGLYGNASGGASNYSLYLVSGNIYSTDKQYWTNNGGTGFSNPVSIGTTNASAMLDIHASDNTTALALQLSGLDGIPHFTVNGQGGVRVSSDTGVSIVGAGSPLLNVAGTISGSALQVNGTSQIANNTIEASGVANDILSIKNLDNTLTANKILGISFLQDIQTVGAVRATATNRNLDYKSELGFWTNTGGSPATTLTKKMMIDSAGNVGIGVTPSVSLETNGTISANQLAIGGTGGTVSNFSTGTYTPALSGSPSSANCDSITFVSVSWYRIGSSVTVYGLMSVDPTTTLTSTYIRMTIPVTSNLTNCVGGSGSYNGEVAGATPIDITKFAANVIQFEFKPVAVSNAGVSFMYSYTIN